MGRGESKLQRHERYLRSKNKNSQNTQALEYYVSGEGMWINQYLRGRGDFGELTDDEKQFIKDLDNATDQIIGERTLYRSVDATAIFGEMDDWDFDNLRTVLNYGADSLGRGSYADGLRDRVNNLIKNTEGKTITEKGFMSATKNEQIAQEWGGFTGSERPVVMKIKTNSNTRGVDVSQFDRNVAAGDEQEEVLIRRDQKYKVGKIYAKNGNVYIDVTMR